MDNSKNNLTEINQGKTVAIVSYLTLVGLVVAFMMNNSQPTSLGRFHIRQSIGITVVAIALGGLSFIPGIGGLLSKIVGVTVLVALVLGVLAALNGQEKVLPVVGQYFQKWFSMI